MPRCTSLAQLEPSGLLWTRRRSADGLHQIKHEPLSTALESGRHAFTRVELESMESRQLHMASPRFSRPSWNGGEAPPEGSVRQEASLSSFSSPRLSRRGVDQPAATLDCVTRSSFIKAADAMYSPATEVDELLHEVRLSQSDGAEVTVDFADFCRVILHKATRIEGERRPDGSKWACLGTTRPTGIELRGKAGFAKALTRECRSPRRNGKTQRTRRTLLSTAARTSARSISRARNGTF